MNDCYEYYIETPIESNKRGFFTTIRSLSFDGSIADVYGETPEEATDMALYIVRCLNLLDEIPNLYTMKIVQYDAVTGNAILEAK